jgi:RNA polymerase sigma-70 factor, ECF subfamily
MNNEIAKSLINEMCGKREAALSTLYSEYRRTVYAFAHQRLSNAAEADEVVQETFFDAWKNACVFRGDSKVSTWLLGIAQNKLLMKFRARGDTMDDVDEMAELLPSDEASAYDAIAAREHSNGVKHCLDGLSPDHRQVLHLAFYEDASVSEIATLVKIPEGTVKTRLFHARQKIKLCLAKLL